MPSRGLVAYAHFGQVCDSHPIPVHTLARLPPTVVGGMTAKGGLRTLNQACYRAFPGSAMCVQNFDDSRSPAIRITYRISLRSSSLWEPRHPSLKVVCTLLMYDMGHDPILPAEPDGWTHAPFSFQVISIICFVWKEEGKAHCASSSSLWFLAGRDQLEDQSISVARVIVLT